MTKQITITMNLAEAEEYRDRLADLVCWLHGWCSAYKSGPDYIANHFPYEGSLDRTDMLMRKIKSAIQDAEEARP
jgi:hypothetical protein